MESAAAQPAQRTCIVTDSSCDLDSATTDELDIGVVPLRVRFGDEEFVDRVEMDADAFWQRAKTLQTLPSTAAPSAGAFVEACRACAQRGADEVVVITLSGALSATIESAQQAAAMLDGEMTVHVVDSRSVTVGLGLLVVAAARAARDGVSADEIVAQTNAATERIRVHGALDTLENLRKGGRIGAAQSLLGSMLSIKPLITVTDGVVAPDGKQRTRAKALSHLVGIVEAAAPDIARIAVMHAACDDVDAFAERVAAAAGTAPLIAQIGPVVGAHAGIGTIGVVFELHARA